MKIKTINITDKYLIIETDDGIRKMSKEFSGIDKIIAKCKDFKERQCLVEYSTWGNYKKSEWFADIWEVQPRTETSKEEIVDSSLHKSYQENGPEITDDGWEIDQTPNKSEFDFSDDGVKKKSKEDIDTRLKLPLGKVFSTHSSQKIYGPPGTGKTTALIEIVKKAISNGTKPEDIAFVAFTNQAANVAKDRVAQAFPELGIMSFPNFSTIHAFATKVGGTGGADLMEEKDFRSFDKNIFCWTEWTELGDPLSSVVRYSHAVLEAYSLSISRLENLDYENIFFKKNTTDALMEFFSIDYGTLAENKPYYCKQYVERYLSFKIKNHLISFDDVIIKVANDEFPQEQIPTFELLIIDEAQDLSKLQWKFAKKLINQSEKAYIAGDDDQAIMIGLGSDPSSFVNLETTEEPRILDQSHRVPRTHYDYIGSGVLGYIRKLNDRVEKVWKPQNRNGSLGSPASLKAQVTKKENKSVMGPPVEVFRPEIDPQKLLQKVENDWGKFNAKIPKPEVYKEKDFLIALEEGEKFIFKTGAEEVLKPLLEKIIRVKEEKSQLDPELINQIIIGVAKNNLDERHLFLLRSLGVFKDEKFQRLVDISQKETKEPPNWLIMSPTKNTGKTFSKALTEMKIPHFYRNQPVGEATKDNTQIRVQTIHISKGAEAENTAIVISDYRDIITLINNPRLAYVALTRAKKRMFPRVVEKGLLAERDDIYDGMFPPELFIEPSHNY